MTKHCNTHNTHRINSLFPYKDRLNCSHKSKVVYKASSGTVTHSDFYMDKMKRRLHDRKSEHFKALTRGCQASAIVDHITSTGHNIKGTQSAFWLRWPGH